MPRHCNIFSSVAIVGLVCLYSCSQPARISNTINISGGWKLQSSAKIAETGKEISTPGSDTLGWYDAKVPSTVLGTLTQRGEYSDAFIGANYDSQDRTPFDTSWWYRKEFDIPALRDGQHVIMEFDGISYAANIWLNGKEVADTGTVFGTFRVHRLDVTDFVSTKNVLAVEVFKARPDQPNLGFVDWNPRPLDQSMGIFRGIKVKTVGSVEMENAAVRSKLNETLTEADLEVEADLTNKSDQTVSGDLVCEFEGKTYKVPQSLLPGETKTIKVTSQEVPAFHLDNPRIWWTWNLGKPELYDMKISFNDNGNVSDEQRVRFGVRDIKQYIDEEGHVQFELNGKKILLRTGGWTDDIFLRDTPESYKLQVSYVKDMNLNGLRLEGFWGNDQTIYNLCDEEGLIILVGWSCQWEWDNYLAMPAGKYGGIVSKKNIELISSSFQDQVFALRNHPAIISWFVGSDKLPTPELEQKYIDFLKERDDRGYLLSAQDITSEISGASGTKMNGPYEYVGPSYWYSEDAPGKFVGFNTETGIGAQLPVIESIRKFIPEDQLWPVDNKAYDQHCTTSDEDMGSLKVLTANITSHYGEAKDLDDYLRKADLLNYDGTRAMFEAFRSNIPHATGIDQWMLNSAWPSLYWQLYDWYKVPTAAYYSVKKANLPCQLVYNYVNKKIIAVNESSSDASLDCNMTLYGLDGTKISSEDKKVEFKQFTPVEAFSVPAFDKNAFLSLTVKDGDGNLVADNFYCLADPDDVHDWNNSSWFDTPIKKAANYTALQNIPEADCTVNATSAIEQGQTTITITLDNKGKALAFFIRLSLKDANGELIVPSYWSDNYISIAPGEKKIITCQIPSKAPTAKTLTVKGWNLKESTISLN
jgi:exo-1,4-beta-D-glucosaminidase